MTISPGAGASASTIWLSGASSVSPVSEGTFMHMMFASAASSAKMTRVCATGTPRSRQKASSPTVASIASWMLPPPNFAGSVKPLTKSTMSSAAFSPNPSRFPKFCVL